MSERRVRMLATKSAKNDSQLEINSRTRLTKLQRDELLSSMTDEEREQSKKLWLLWARDNQLPPDNEEWDYWLYMAGRGGGKTRSGAEWIRDQVEVHHVMRSALVGATA